MANSNVTSVFKKVGASISKHSPEILTAVGLAGGLTTVILAVKATPKAMDLIDEAKRAKQADTPEEEVVLTKKEVVKAAWKPYIPAAVTGVTSTICILGSRSVSARRSAALATAYKISETALSEYREKVIETVGEVKEKEIRKEVVKEKVKKNPPNTKEVIITEKGETLCFDAISGRYFKSDVNAIEAAVNRLNAKLLSDDYVSLNEFYYEINLPPVGIGEDLGWNMGRDGLVTIDLDSHLSEDNKPCLAIDYVVRPRYDYSRLM